MYTVWTPGYRPQMQSLKHLQPTSSCDLHLHYTTARILSVSATMHALQSKQQVCDRALAASGHVVVDGGWRGGEAREAQPQHVGVKVALRIASTRTTAAQHAFAATRGLAALSSSR